MDRKTSWPAVSHIWNWTNSLAIWLERCRLSFEAVTHTVLAMKLAPKVAVYPPLKDLLSCINTIDVFPTPLSPRKITLARVVAISENDEKLEGAGM